MDSLCQYSAEESPRVVKDMDLASWYKTDNLSENLRTVISRVSLVEQSEPNSSDSK